jgi:hypothetical protein
VSKQRLCLFYIDRFSLKKLNEVEGKEQYCVGVSNKFAFLEDLDTDVEINSAWEMIRGKYKDMSQSESRLV